MPRPFDQPDDVPATASVKAPWAEPVSNDGATDVAPEPAGPVTARIRHISGSVQSPGKPLSWRVKPLGATVGAATAATIRPTAHLQDATEPAETAEVVSQPEFGGPRLAQGKNVPALTPAAPDPAVPVPPPTEPDATANDGATQDDGAVQPPPTEEVRPARPRTLRSNPLAPTPREEPDLTPVPSSPRSGGRGREQDLNLLRDVPCDRMYGPDKNRNCCAEELLCGEARKRVKQLTISRIKVDITPTCNLAGEWHDAPETKCGWQLELSPVRPWKDKSGKQVAYGRFSGFAHARVVITDENGEETKIKMGDLNEDDRCFVTAWCGLPFECGLVDEPLLARNWQPVTFTWKASGLCHKPLYFEDAQLERYGHTFGPVVQPFASGAHFFANIALMPYNMGIHPMTECQYSLGYYRPGGCAPRILPPFPLSVRGALMEAGAWVGGVYLIP